MIELMERLIETGHAYAACGDVYFDVLSYPDYGQLSGHRIDDVHQGEGVATGSVTNAISRCGRARSPASRRGRRRGGVDGRCWHLECSAMAHTYLGPEFDIHCGGMDLVFPAP